MGLARYFQKRNFQKTPEPRGKPVEHQDGYADHKADHQESSQNARKLAFVIQKHHASSLHYDFRLELDGVLKSWAVPKGPSLNPHEHHLAIQTEDHPYAYREFEGVIPEGNYGAGNVIIWDEGWYEARKGNPADSETTLRRELKKGHLTFILHGKKLHGEFALIRMHQDDGGTHGHRSSNQQAWLLVKKGDEFASETDITMQETSVKTHRRVDDLGAQGRLPDVRARALSTYPKKVSPWRVRPMLCTLIEEPFSREGWLFEIKWDGYRAIGSKKHDKIELYSRNGIDFAAKYPAVTEALRAFRHDVLVDGEIVVVDDQGVPHFEWLHNYGRSHGDREDHTAHGASATGGIPSGVTHASSRHTPGELRYYLFDILWCDGHDLRELPLIERKKILKSLIPYPQNPRSSHDDKDNDIKHPPQNKGVNIDSILHYSDHIETTGHALFAQMKKRGLEGMVAKRADSPYREDVRGQDWLKIKTHQRQEVVIGGYTEPRGARKYLGSLLAGVYSQGKLGKREFHYVGHSGGGIPDNERKALQAKLARLERATSPFTHEPKPNAPVHWVRPELVCEMSFSEWTEEGCMRHPQFEGLRPDKNPTSVHREVITQSQATAQSSVHLTHRGRKLPFQPTHLDKTFFPKHGYTKGDLFAYYESVADFILPYLKDRPCSLNRMPNGITGESFYQKNNEHLPEWVPYADIFSESHTADSPGGGPHGGNLRWMVGGRLETLVYMVQLGCVEINPWNSRVGHRVGHLDKPDWIVIDLDPEGVGFENVIEVARTVKEVCDEWGIASYPKTSGKTGLHIYIPMHAKYSYEQGKNLAHLIALEVNKRQPKLTSVERLPKKRKHKIYLDFLQNREGQTLAAPYSVRPTPDATVSMPLHWEEVRSGLKPESFTIRNAPARIKRTGDLWRPVLGKGIDLASVLKKAAGTNLERI